jgi:uncharacterized membrane protein
MQPHARRYGACLAQIGCLRTGDAAWHIVRNGGDAKRAYACAPASPPEGPMEARVKVLGHPVHQMLIVFPLGLLTTAVIFDLIRLATGSSTWSLVSYWMIAAGIIGGLCAALFGIIDWFKIPSGTRAYRLGLWHGLGNVVMVAVFAVSWFLRRPDPGNPTALAIVLLLLGGGLSLVTGWLGGELVDRLGVGVDDGANLNAPSSLSGPAAERHAHGD